jgi:hypothetical protein
LEFTGDLIPGENLQDKQEYVKLLTNYSLSGNKLTNIPFEKNIDLHIQGGLHKLTLNTPIEPVVITGHNILLDTGYVGVKEPGNNLEVYFAS